MPARPHRPAARLHLRAPALALAIASGCFSESPAQESTAASIGEGGSSGEPSTSSGDTTSGASSTDAGDTTTTPIVTDGSLDTGGTTAADSGESSGGADDSSTTAPDATSSSSGGESSSSGEPEPLTVDQLVPGDLVITEVMWNPYCTGDACEWVELWNATGQVVNLLDLYVQDIDESVGNQGRITDDVFVGPGEYAVIARGIGDWPYFFEATAAYGPNPGLNNSDPDTVLVRSEAMVLDEIPTLPFDTPQGTAWSLSGSTLGADDNDNAFNWCLADTVLDTTVTDEYGTPLEANPDC
ncbi:MAG: lamin tail domain-containing protein [Deltaproteobacteria bacterium]|nr:lamin tail domain-containing protein [Deltaproteobacteria bacterium]MBK8714764.1 lamin tail domain-containing protein [Deltaproteobacteria bacterium]MBP7289561.1 lamin tail domain-containing protein [Nannocystaceae bacterium]